MIALTGIQLIHQYGYKETFKLFYLKPFTKSHIQKYFKNWIKDTKESNLWINNVQNRIWVEDNKIIYSNGKSTYFHIMNVITIGDFISDCIRTGIELTFTDESLKELEILTNQNEKNKTKFNNFFCNIYNKCNIIMAEFFRI